MMSWRSSTSASGRSAAATMRSPSRIPARAAGLPSSTSVGAAKPCAVVGAGFIGCEVAAAFAARGLETTILELGPYLLNMALDEETGRWIGEHFAQRGVRVIVRSAAARFLGVDGTISALETGEGQRIECDLVAVGIGIALNTEVGERAGLKIDDGLLVDEHLETEFPGIYAAGDIARFYQILYEAWDRAPIHSKAPAWREE